HSRRVACVVYMIDLYAGKAGLKQLSVSDAGIVQRHVIHGRERWSQSAEAFQRGFGPREFLMVQSQFAIVLVNRHQASFEISFVDGVRRPPLTFDREAVDLL